jgi:multiple sugar transport system substrate-binding protein
MKPRLQYQLIWRGIYMKTYSKGIMMLIILIMIAGLFVTGCSSNNAEPNSGNTSQNTSKNTSDSSKDSGDAAVDNAKEEVTVHFTNFSASGDNEKYLAQMEEEFEKQFEHINVEIETIGYDEYFTQMQTRVAGGTAPDAYELNYENFVSYAKKGVLMDMDGLFDITAFDSSTMNSNAIEAFSTDGIQYGLPSSFSNVVLFYNKDLFDQANVDYPTNDWTWADEQAAAEKIKALGDGYYGIFQPVQFWEFYKVVQQNGGSFLNEDQTQFTINSPQNVETLQFMVDRVMKSNVMPTDAQLSGMGDWDLFKSGKLGMLVTGIWAFPDFSGNIDFNWDIEVEPGNKSKATHFFSNGLVINKDSKVANEAFEWVKFLSASKEAAQIRVDAGWELPASKYPDILEAYLQVTPPANKQAVFDSLDYLVTPPVVEQNAEMTDIVNLYLGKAKEGVMTPAEALDEAQKELESKIKLD